MKVRNRLLVEQDLSLVMDWRMRPYITRYMNTDPQLTLEKQKKWYEQMRRDSSQINWIIELEEEPVGLLNVFDIDRNNKRCSWGYYIAEQEKRSLKLALYLEWNLYDYVFEKLRLHKLCNETFLENTQVIMLHQMCGSHQDGVMRDHIYKNGRYYDVSVGSIIESEWLQKKKKVNYEIFMFEDWFEIRE